ncbi:MAG TPA: isoamylase early set domain-containing protein [Gemmatimonas sp.]|uniref:isoamylase early set domain-containing protein n=1 Tax=Gemmatimonas sp. TaxID=1962908 RepID=UPI002ED786E1
MSDDSERPPDALTRAIAELQQEVPVRDAWRDALERELARADMHVDTYADTPGARTAAARPIRGWRVTPVGALAAATIFMVAGAMLADVVRQRGASGNGPGPALVASMPASNNVMGVRFAVMAPGVQRVSLVGDFNGWNADVTPLTLLPDGRTWTTMLPLSSGRHTYAFVIDGQIVRDPIAPAEAEEDFGMPNSVVLVSSRE